MSDYSLSTRRAAMIALKHDTGMIALVPAGSNYPGTVPANRTYPFTRYGTLNVAPFQLSGLDASTTRFALQGLTQGVKNNAGALIVTAEDHAHRIGAAMVNALNGVTLPIDDNMHVRIEWVTSLVSLDGDDSSIWTIKATFDGDIAG